jgi:hypothetical protein
MTHSGADSLGTTNARGDAHAGVGVLAPARKEAARERSRENLSAEANPGGTASAGEGGTCNHMKASSKVSVLLVVALLATAAVAASAQAQSITPAGPVSGVAASPFLDYEGVPVICDTGTADGTADGSDRISDLVLDFFGNCGVAGVLPAEVACAGTVTLIAQDPVANTGTVELNEGFRCDVTTDLCVITVEGPQTTQDGNTTLTGEGSGDPKLVSAVDVFATNNGSDICGPPSGTGSFSAEYDVTPTNISIDP